MAQQKTSPHPMSQANAGSILSTSDIRTHVKNGLLISDGFNEDNLGGCCYEFRAGPIAYRYNYEQKSTRQEKTDLHMIYPFETMTIITMEKVLLDAKHFLFLFSKGSMFSLGVVPVCTGADPGFSGHLGITLTNISARPIRVPAGTRLIKGWFSRLTSPATKLYTGQHGDATMNWPYPNQFHADDFDLKEYSKHLSRFLPAPIVAAVHVSRTVAKYLRWTIVTLTVLATTNLLAYFLSIATPKGWSDKLLLVLSVIGSVASVVGLAISVLALIQTKPKHG
jgi:dCTP deaminase